MEETDEERRKEGETEGGLLSGGNDGRVVEKVGQVESGRKEGDREFAEDGGSVAALTCGRWVDRVVELWL